jgi:calcineurin-like phosphoesterase family protein
MEVINLLFYGFILLSLLLIIKFFLSKGKIKKAYVQKVQKNWRSTSKSNINESEHFVFLIGDTGAPRLDGTDEVLALLKSKLYEAGENSTVIFLGDIVYPVGLPEPGHKYYELSEKRLLVQLEILKDYPGNVYFISGNHDWNRSRGAGLDSVNRQENYIESYLGRKDVYLPSNGCPGPVEIEITSQLTLIIINTSWWVHRGTKPLGEEYGCVESEEEFFEKFKAMLEENKNKDVLIAAHHPLYSKAIHGGKFDLQSHLFPLTAAHKSLYIPLPGVGSLFPAYRKYIGALEDMSHPKYRSMRKRLLASILPYKNIVWAAGHDHNLQYLIKNDHHHIVSGAGSKVAYVKSGGKSAVFTHAHKGFFILDYKKNEAVWMEVWEPEAGKDTGKLAFSTKIY